MKIIIYFLVIILSVISCKTEEPQNPPTVITNAASNITFRIATLNGEVTNEGFSAASDRGFVYSEKNSNPSVSDSKAQSGYGKGVYFKSLDNLLVNTKYYFKAYASNSKGTSYGEVQSFISGDYEYKLPTAITDIPLNITYNSADLGGIVTDAGELIITQRGICYGLNPNPTILDNKVISGEGLGVFKISLQNLKDNSKYYVRAFAINSKGIAYGNEQSFTTNSAPVKPRDNTTKIVEVKSKTGRIWMDRNLGASQAATSSTDEKAYGDLYQWGRGADGHQSRTSATSTKLSNSDVPGHSDFIITILAMSQTETYDWRRPKNDNLWQGVNEINNPCPAGFRLPTEEEWFLERLSWGSNKAEDAFKSPLKLPEAGWRYSNGTIEDLGLSGKYWSSGFYSTYAISIGFPNDNYPQLSGRNRNQGLSVRCIKD